jgi:hypothetical protein
VEKLKELLTKYWYIVAGVVLYMMMGKKKKRRSRRGTRKMKAMRIANSRLRRQVMYQKMRPRRVYRR